MSFISKSRPMKSQTLRKPPVGLMGLPIRELQWPRQPLTSCCILSEDGFTELFLALSVGPGADVIVELFTDFFRPESVLARTVQHRRGWKLDASLSALLRRLKAPDTWKDAESRKPTCVMAPPAVGTSQSLSTGIKLASDSRRLKAARELCCRFNAGTAGAGCSDAGCSPAGEDKGLPMTASGVEADIGGIGGLEHLLIERCFMSASYRSPRRR